MISLTPPIKKNLDSEISYIHKSVFEYAFKENITDKICTFL